jgi:haloacetate dehalogenase
MKTTKIKRDQSSLFFENFKLEMIELPNSVLRVRYGGSGPPVLLLHGHPRTHTTWHKVAPLLAAHFTVVCPDLRGFGKSTVPADRPDHLGSSKREKANDCIELMKRLGFSAFAVVGHDRGAYTAFRAAMDYPANITQLVILDAIPILEALERCNEKFAKAWWHWFFYGQPEKPESAILADPDTWYKADPIQMGQLNYQDFLAAIHDPDIIHGMVEDYRAGLGIDRSHDQQDRLSGRKVICPSMCLWSSKDDLELLYDDVLTIWKGWMINVIGRSIISGHHMAEEAPEELAKALLDFIER